MALVTQLLTAAFDAHPTATIHDLYNDLINLENLYRVQNYEDAPGKTITRDHEIRYFAIDDRLYHEPAATRRTPTTTEDNPWVSLVHQPSCRAKTLAPTWTRCTRRSVAISKTR